MNNLKSIWLSFVIESYLCCYRLPNSPPPINELVTKRLLANIYLFKVNNRSTRKWYELCSKLTIKTRTTLLTRYFGVFIVTSENIFYTFF